jgi:hypothetical protein
MRKFPILSKILSAGIFLGSLLLANFASAEIRVAFFRFPPGQVSKHERYYHVAIFFEGQWLHADAWWGVQLVPTLEEMESSAYVILSDPRSPPLTSDAVANVLGKKFDFEMDWSDNERLYCSELVAKLLGIPPTPMDFVSSQWPKGLQKTPGALGISPDEIYEELLKRGYRDATCEARVL